MDLNNYLEESADLVYDKSKELCKHGIMDENCYWYHSVWQYLRLLNLVSTPVWHDTFYIAQLQNALKSKGINNILISGAADYSMLAYVVDAIKKTKANAKVYVLDTCKTPLYACRWFAEKENFQIEIINEDIFKYKNDNYFDIVCTDAFLTRFDKKSTKKVVKAWEKLLNKTGSIITTVRIHDEKDNLTAEQKEKYINEFAEKARERCEKNQKYIQYSPRKLSKMAEEYARKMISYNIGNKEEILEIFNDFTVSYSENIVLGEFYRTRYLEIVAKKK